MNFEKMLFNTTKEFVKLHGNAKGLGAKLKKDLVKIKDRCESTIKKAADEAAAEMKEESDIELEKENKKKTKKNK